MIREDDGVEVEDGGGGVEEEVERKRGVVEGVVVLVVVKMITCLVVWQPSQECWWAALGVRAGAAGEGVKSIVSGVGKEEGEV